MLLAYPDWMIRVVFDDPRVDASMARKQPPWGQSQRRFVLGSFSQGMRIGIGQLDNSAGLPKGRRRHAAAVLADQRGRDRPRLGARDSPAQ